MPFEPGNQLSKNRDRNAERRFRAALNNLIEKNPERLDRVAGQLVSQAEAGDIQAIKELADRLDGKPVQAIAGADGEGPVQHALTVRFIRAPKQ